MLEDYPFAALKDGEVKELKTAEERLRNETNEEIILIAYKKEESK